MVPLDVVLALEDKGPQFEELVQILTPRAAERFLQNQGGISLPAGFSPPYLVVRIRNFDEVANAWLSLPPLHLCSASVCRPVWRSEGLFASMLCAHPVHLGYSSAQQGPKAVFCSENPFEIPDCST